MVWWTQYRKEKNEIKFTVYDVMKTHNYFGVVFCPRIFTHTLVVDA